MRFNVDFPRALDKNDVVWAEDCRHSVLSELVRVVYYKNDRFLRRLKGVDLELEEFPRKPRGFIRAVREIAAADPGQALPRLRELLKHVKSR